MLFKKIIPALEEASFRLDIDELNPFQAKIIPKVKSGANVFVIGPEGSGKTIAMILSVIQKLKGKPKEIILVQ